MGKELFVPSFVIAAGIFTVVATSVLLFYLI